MITSLRSLSELKAITTAKTFQKKASSDIILADNTEWVSQENRKINSIDKIWVDLSNLQREIRYKWIKCKNPMSKIFKIFDYKNKIKKSSEIILLEKQNDDHYKEIG